jgi:hypothetical protein
VAGIVGVAAGTVGKVVATVAEPAVTVGLVVAASTLFPAIGSCARNPTEPAVLSS